MAHSMPNYSKILQIQEGSFQKQGAAWGCAARSTHRDVLLYPKTHLVFAEGLHPTLNWQFLQSKLGPLRNCTEAKDPQLPRSWFIQRCDGGPPRTQVQHTTPCDTSAGTQHHPPSLHSCKSYSYLKKLHHTYSRKDLSPSSPRSSRHH